MTSPKPFRRTTSKRVLYLNTIGAWALAFFGVHMGNEVVVSAALAFIAALYGTYTGVGHLDLRQAESKS